MSLNASQLKLFAGYDNASVPQYVDASAIFEKPMATKETVISFNVPSDSAFHTLIPTEYEPLAGYYACVDNVTFASSTLPLIGKGIAFHGTTDSTTSNYNALTPNSIVGVSNATYLEVEGEGILDVFAVLAIDDIHAIPYLIQAGASSLVLEFAKKDSNGVFQTYVLPAGDYKVRPTHIQSMASATRLGRISDFVGGGATYGITEEEVTALISSSDRNVMRIQVNTGNGVTNVVDGLMVVNFDTAVTPQTAAITIDPTNTNQAIISNNTSSVGYSVSSNTANGGTDVALDVDVLLNGVATDALSVKHRGVNTIEFNIGSTSIYDGDVIEIRGA